MALNMNLSAEHIGKLLKVVDGMSPAEIRVFLQEKTGLTASDDEIKKALDFLNKHRAKPLTDEDLDSAAGGLGPGVKTALSVMVGTFLGLLAYGSLPSVAEQTKKYETRKKKKEKNQHWPLLW